MGEADLHRAEGNRCGDTRPEWPGDGSWPVARAAAGVGRRLSRPLLPFLVAALLAGAAVSPAGASPREAAPTPVIPLRLGETGACTGGSTILLDEERTPWAQRRLELRRAQRYGGEGDGVTVAVVDTGVSRAAPALAGRVSAVRDAGSDCVGHGSFVAGLIVGRADGETGFAGVAPKARILAVRGTDDRGVPDAATVAQGIREATEAGADVIQVSAALPTGSVRLTSAVATALDSGAVVVAAAAPDAPAAADDADVSKDYWPAAQTGVLSVWGVGPEGDALPGLPIPRRADLAAPGGKIVGTGPVGRGHFLGTGSSLAAAFTAGAAALVLSADPELGGAEVRRRLVATARRASVPYLDPYAAVTADGDGGAATEAGSRGSPPLRLASADPAEVRAIRRAALLAGIGVGAILLAAWSAAAIPRGRTRGWRSSPGPPPRE